jgi:histidinol-phosphate aminotransferase
MITNRRKFFGNVVAASALTAALPLLAGPAFGEPPSEEKKKEPENLILLGRNENAYGPSQRVVASMRESLQFANRYPDSAVTELHTSIAQSHSVKRAELVMGCGSGEILNTSAAAFLGPGKKLITAVPTFEAIGRFARILGAEVIEVPLAKNYSHDLSAMLDRADASTGLVYICNPNNPTGSLTPRAELEHFIGKLPATATVLIDEAYHHFVGATPEYASFLDKPLTDERVLVARTFSKVYGLAGMRVGYAVGSPARIQTLANLRLAEGLNAVAARCALVALDDVEYMKFSAKRNAADRQEFFRQAQTRNITVIPSSTNFAMLSTGIAAATIIDHFHKNGIQIARLFPSMDKFARVSFGKPNEMKEFWRVWDLMPAQKS